MNLQQIRTVIPLKTPNYNEYWLHFARQRWMICGIYAAGILVLSLMPAGALGGTLAGLALGRGLLGG